MAACGANHRSAAVEQRARAAPGWTVAAALAALCACTNAPRRPEPVKIAAAAEPAPAMNGASASAAAAPAAPADAKTAAGAGLYKTKGCVMCHGEEAKGGVPNRYSLSETIPALDKVAEGYTEDELKEKIRKGVPSVAKKDPKGHVAILLMPSWEDKLAQDELDAVVAYLMSLALKGEGASKDDF